MPESKYLICGKAVRVVAVYFLLKGGWNRLYNIRKEKIFADNVYQFLLFFDKLYGRFTDIEKKTFMKSFLTDANIYKEEQPD